MTLKEARVGSTVTVTRLTGTGAVKRRIMDMGITKGVEIHIRKVAPLGDPVEVTVRGLWHSWRYDMWSYHDVIIYTVTDGKSGCLSGRTGIASFDDRYCGFLWDRLLTIGYCNIAYLQVFLQQDDCKDWCTSLLIWRR